MEPLSKNHLVNRKGVWYYRRRVPEHLVAHYKKQFIQFSLRTSNLREAYSLRNLHDVRYDMEFANNQQALKNTLGAHLDGKKSQPLPRNVAEEKISEYVREKLAAFNHRYLKEPATSVEQRDAFVQDKELTLQALGDPKHPDQHSAIWQVFEKLFSEAVFEQVTESEVAELIRRYLIRLIRDELGVINDDFSQISTEAAVAPKAAPPSPTFTEVAMAYLAEEREKASHAERANEWVEKLASQVDQLVEMVGKDTKIDAVDYDAAKRVQSILVRIPAHKEKRYPNMSIEAAISICEKQNGRTLSASTQKGYLSTFKGILSLAVAKRLIANNPALTMKPLGHDARGAADKRLPFTDEQIAEFFSSDFYKLWLPSTGMRYSKPDRDWRFWLPLLMCFNGMRPGEACQLLVGDISKNQSGVLFAAVTPSIDDDDVTAPKKLKTKTSKRNFPIHPSLISVGFEDFLAIRQASGSKALLFEGLKPSKRGYYSDYPCRRFREAFLGDAIALEKDQTFYSFRHSFRDALRRVNAPPDVLLALGGWSEGKNASDAYGDPKSPDYLSKYVNKISYSGVKLDFHYVP